MNSTFELENIPLTSLKGIGDKTAALFEKAGVGNLNDLLHYYPRTYEYFPKPVKASELAQAERTAIETVITKRAVLSGRGAKKLTIQHYYAEGVSYEAVWFNMPYLAKTLVPGRRIILYGEVGKKGNTYIFRHPRVFTLEEYAELQSSIRPIYSLVTGLRNKTVLNSVQRLLEKTEILDYLPNDLLTENQLQTREFSLQRIHFPVTRAALSEALKRLKFDEFLLFILESRLQDHNELRTGSAAVIQKTDYAKQLIGSLPFSLTEAQKKAWEEIRDDLGSNLAMNRLLQGDVGSGKTIVAVLAMLCAVQEGQQCALMAPTELLANQHYCTITNLISQADLPIEPPALLTGSTKSADKKRIREGIANGSIKILVGTHALIQEGVDFDRLTLAVIDEQHKFGVNQRRVFTQKYPGVHTLIMSATPIPRTMAMVLFGNRSVSRIDELPKSRLPIKNCAVDTSYRPSAYQFIAKEIQKGHQAYIVCPMIEKNEEMNCESVEEYAGSIKDCFPAGTRIGKLHGRMEASKKDKIMEKFADGQIDILVATTVIEVGIDVKNATVMMIENADRFGLAQLHQLRGRIGRWKDQAYCIFVSTKKDVNDDPRLKILCESTDGFRIAKEDLLLRGQGDLFGIRQSGESSFDLADPVSDSEIFEAALHSADTILTEDAGLESNKYKALKDVLQRRKRENTYDSL